MRDFVALQVKLKEQMNDIIDVAYRDRTPALLRQLKRFSIYCTSEVMRTKLGQCAFHRAAKTSNITIYALADEGYKEILITTMHEVSHHIDCSIRGSTGHDAPFYLAHKKLLFAAMDMGILAKEDVVNSTSRARNRNKLAGMMREYVPNPVSYKEDVVQVFVYDAYSVKDSLKARGYKWNSLDAAWVLATTAPALATEKQYLSELGVKEKNIKVLESNAVVARLRKNVRLYGVPFDSKEIVKGLSFRWVPDDRCWEKKIDGDALSPSEHDALKSIPGVVIKIT